MAVKIAYCIWTQAGVELFKKETYDKYQMRKNNPILYILENERVFYELFYEDSLRIDNLKVPYAN